MTLDTPDVCPPRYNVKVKHKTKGANIVYRSAGGAPKWLERFMYGLMVLMGGYALILIQQILKGLHIID